MRQLIQDLRYTVRILARAPGFTIVAILTLALGIAANVCIFTLINSLILRPLPYPQPDRVVQIDRLTTEGPYYGMSLTQFRSYRQQNTTFEYLSAYDILGSGLSLSTGQDAELIASRRASTDFFRAVGIAPAIGRSFDSQDDRAGATPVAILSDRVWRDSFHRSTAVIGQPVRLSGQNYTVIGVLPSNFTFARDADIWVLLHTSEISTDRASAFNVLGRLRPGVSYEVARQNLDAINQRIRQDYPGVIDANEVGPIVTPYQDRVVGDVRPVLLLLTAAVSAVLLIACSNVASLFLARAVNRRKEIAIRAALGVTRARLLRQLLTESTLISLAGGLIGLLMSNWGLRLFLLLASNNIPHVSKLALDWHVLAFTFVLSLMTGVLFGIAPAFQLDGLSAADVLRESGRTTASVPTRRIQGFFVSGEICIATVLLLGAGLLIASFAKLSQIDPGFDPRHVLTMKTSLAAASFSSSRHVEAVVKQSVERLQSLPGVQAVAVGTMLPTEPSVQLSFELPSLSPPERPALDSEVQWRAISPAYFEVMKIPVMQGRSFSEGDSHGTTSVAIVNQAFVKKYFAHTGGMGQPILIGRQEGPQFADSPRQIVGVAADTRENALNEEPSPTVFVPLAQVPEPFLAFTNSLMPINWLIRVSSDPLSFARTVHSELLTVDPDLVASHPRPLTEVLSGSLSQSRLEAVIVGFFSVTALLLGAIGLYALLAYSVNERKREIGIRLALGADQPQILRLIIVQGLKLTLTGICIGVAIALVLSRFMNSLLFGVGATDPLTFTVVVAVLILVAITACYVPAYRAMRVDPIVALRYE
jgi:putative ABC transport system permease protein